MDAAERASLKRELEIPKNGPIDWPYAMLTLMITVMGLIMLYSASYAKGYYEFDGNSFYHISRQGTFAIIGVLAMFFISRMDYQYFRLFSIPLMLIAVVLLLMVLVIGYAAGGSTRWIDFKLFNVQPSEIAKIAVIVLFSTMISSFGERMKSFRYGILPFGIILAVIAVLMLLEPHFSGTILILVTGATLMFVGGVHWGWFAGLFGAAAAGIYLLMTVFQYSSSRIQVWLDPFNAPAKEAYQIKQSLYAVGSGGWFGLGLGQSRQKFLYLPEQHNDFIFAIICEELGMVGACLVLAMFTLLVIRGYWIALHASDSFGSLIVVGITTLLAVQVFLNVAVVTNLIPVTGISLPFFSYGGSSLLIQLGSMGIVLAVSRQIPAPEKS